MPRLCHPFLVNGLFLVGCGSASPTFVVGPSAESPGVVISVRRNGGHIDLSSSIVSSATLDDRASMEITFGSDEELLWLVFDDEALGRGLRARPGLDDLSRVHLRASSGLDCGVAGQELSYDETSGSVVRQSLSHLQPALWKLTEGETEFREDSLSREPDLSGFELELPADVEDCGLTAPTSGTPFTEGGVFHYPFNVGTATITVADYWLGEILGLAPLGGERYALQARHAIYAIERGTTFDPSRDPHLTMDELPVPRETDLLWDIRTVASVPKADARGYRVFLLVFSYTATTKDRRHAVILEFEFDGFGFSGGTTRWFGDNVDFPESLVVDALGGIVMYGRNGLVVFAENGDAPFVARTVGSGDLRAIATSVNTRYRHVLTERGGGFFAGDLSADMPLQQRNSRASLTATSLALDPGPNGRMLYSGWRDGQVYVTDLSVSDTFRSLDFEISRRASECAAPTTGDCGRTPASVELSGLGFLGSSPQGDELIVLLSGCSHGILFSPSNGCTRALGEGRPTAGNPILRPIGTTDGVIWLGGHDGQVYSIP